MRVEELGETTVGVPLNKVAFGSVVARPVNLEPWATYYLVASSMDGTGRRVLVTFSGTIKEVEQNASVIPVKAHVVVGKD